MQIYFVGMGIFTYVLLQRQSASILRKTQYLSLKHVEKHAAVQDLKTTLSVFRVLKMRANSYPLIYRWFMPMFLTRLVSRFFPPFLLLLAVTAAAAEEKAVYILSVMPQFTPGEIHRNWTPIVDKLSRATGRQIEIKIYSSVQKFETAFLKGEIDLAFMNPYLAVMAKRAQGYIPLVRDDTSLINGILVVRHDSLITSTKELDGKRIAFPAPNSFGASLYIRALLHEQEKISITPYYLKTFSNTYRHVISGDAVAGGGISTWLKQEPPEIQSQLRILFETPGWPSPPLVAHPRMPAELRQIVINTLLEMQNDPDGQKMLKQIRMSKLIKAYYAKDYQYLEKLKLEKYIVLDGSK